MTTDEIARLCHELNRAYCEQLGDVSQVPWENAPPEVQRSAIAGVEAAADRGADWSAQQQHAAWEEYWRGQGWRYGQLQSVHDRTHPNLVPWAELPAAQRRKDVLFLAVLRACRQPA